MAVMTWMTRRGPAQTAQDLETHNLRATIEDALNLLDKMTGVDVEEIPDNHPMIFAWRGYEYSLAIYGMLLCLDWHLKRGQADQLFYEFHKTARELAESEPGEHFYKVPPWFYDTDVLRSHRSNLVRRHPETYRDTWKDVPVNWPYLWPVIDPEEEDGYKLMLSKGDKKRLREKTRTLPQDVLERVANA